MFTGKKIAFIGAGSMAESIIAGLIAEKIVSPTQIIATNKQNKAQLTYLENTYGIHVTSEKEIAMQNADIVILAMKPKNVVDGVKDIKPYALASQLFISVLAGISTTYISELLESKAPVIRTMPNTSAKVGASATGMAAGLYANEDHVQVASTLFQAVGTVSIVAEDKLDAVTGVAGSGPAYIYYLVEAMEQAATECGLEQEEAKQLITQTLFGAAKRLQSTSKTPAELYKEVMSPGGTTEAGMKVLADYQFQDAAAAAIKRATARSKELGSILSETSTK